ncbi:zf-CCHC domain-containing protein [Tanacetum coccineum]
MALPTNGVQTGYTIEEFKGTCQHYLDELIGRSSVNEVVLEKDLEVLKNKKEKYKSLALKARQVLSEDDASSSDSNDEEYAMAVRDFKKFFRRRGKFVRQPYDDKKNFRKAKEDKKEKEDRRCFKCGDPNHFINDCPKHSFGDQKAFVVGCWSDSGDDSKKEEICLMAQSNEVQSDTPYYSSSSLDNESRQDERQLERNKEIRHECESCDKLVIEISSLKLKLASFENSSSSLRKMVEMQKPSKDKYGLGYTEDIASTSNNKIKNLGPQNDKMLSVEPATPVPSTTEPACSDEQNRLSAAKTENAKKAKILGSNIIKKNDSAMEKAGSKRPTKWPMGVLMSYILKAEHNKNNSSNHLCIINGILILHMGQPNGMSKVNHERMNGSKIVLHKTYDGQQRSLLILQGHRRSRLCQDNLGGSHSQAEQEDEKIVPYPRFISLLLEHVAPNYDNKELIINPTQVFSVHNWILKPNQPEEPPFTDHMKAICNLDVPVDPKAPKYSSLTKEVPRGKKLGARSGLRRKQF